jgi:hypothetical protein
MPKGIYIRSEKSKKKMSEYWKNFLHNNPNKLNKLINNFKGKKHTKESLEKIKLAGMRPCKEETKLKISKANKDRKLNVDWKREKNHNWKGGLTPIISMVRHCRKMIEWRKTIFARDKYTCQECGKIGGNIHAHHIVGFSLIFKESNVKTYNEIINYKIFWDLNNGKTLCESCHKKIHNYNMRSS